MNKYAHLSKQDEARRRLYKRIHTGSRLATCIKKRRHNTREAAIEWSESQGYSDMRPYQCNQCHFWHMSSKPKKKVDKTDWFIM